VRNAIAALSLVFLAAHLPFLPPTLEDIDSINFALAVNDFDVAKHQPHPPGYPVFVALGKAGTWILRLAQVPSAEVRGLAMLSVVWGASLVPLLYVLFFSISIAGRGLHTRPGNLQPSTISWLATVVAVTCPLFWFTALRPLSDTTGLAAAVAAQALIISALAGIGPRRALTYGGLMAGVALGIRAQTFLLTLPLLGLALGLPRTGLRARDRLAALAALTLGVLAWGAPLIIASGGPSSYAAALGSQAGEDFSGVVMLWTTRTARVALDAVMYSFLWPWGHPVGGGIVVAAAVVGGLGLIGKMPRSAALLLLAYLPYALFHLLFQETITVRYALPLVVPIAYLAVFGLGLAGKTLTVVAATAIVAWSLTLTIPAAISYGRHGSPAFVALTEAMQAGASGPRVVGAHAVARRAVEWLEWKGQARAASGSPVPVRFLTAPHGREWLALVEQWRTDPAARVAFVADPRRTDLALIDPASRRPPLPFRWSFAAPPFVGGTRPGNSDLYAMASPGWMLDRGWALSAEIAGVTARDGLGPHRKPSLAWVRTRDDAVTLLLGGRHLGAASDPAARVIARLNGATLDTAGVKAGFFFRVLELPAGSLSGDSGYSALTVGAEAADGSTQRIPVALEQFDLQSTGVPMIGVQDGWYEPEYDPRTSRAWRWSSERSVLWVRPVGRDVTLTLSGESPLRYYEVAPAVIVSLAGLEVARFSPSADFTQEIVLPASALAAARGEVVITSDKFFVPAERSGSQDRRHLALKIYSYGVR
jgi:hypothetical protein